MNDKDNVMDAAIEYCSGNKGADARVRAGFVMGAHWQEERLIDKACEWLLDNIRYYSTNTLGTEYQGVAVSMVQEFRKAMKAEETIKRNKEYEK